MSRRKKISDAEPLNDRERILSFVISQLSTTQILTGRTADGYHSAGYRDSDGSEYVHFAYDQKPKAGDLVVGKTGGVGPWKIGFFVKDLPPDVGGAVIREIGSDLLCNYYNESFVPIRGLDFNQGVLLEGKRYQIYRKVMQAFARGDEYLYRYGGIRFNEDATVATVTIREVFGGTGKTSVPFDVDIPIKRPISVKRILETLRAGGYGTKSFRPKEIDRSIDFVRGPDNAENGSE